MIPTIPIAWYAIAALAVTNLFSGYMWQQASHDLTVIELRGEIAAVETKQTIKDQTQITKDTTDGWKAALDVTRAHYDKRLRSNAASGVPTVPSTAPGTDVPSEDTVPAPARVEAECAEATLNLNHIQNWVSKQRELR